MLNLVDGKIVTVFIQKVVCMINTSMVLLLLRVSCSNIIYNQK